MSHESKKGSRRARPGLGLLCVFALASPMLAPTALGVARAVTELIEIDDQLIATEQGEQLDAAQNAFRANLADREFDSALEQAKRVVELSLQIWGSEHPNFSRALTNLAIAQSEAADFVSAQQNFVAAIESREAVDGHLVGGELINPLNGLANASIAMNDLEGAVPLFERSVHISHVTAGPNNLEQLDTLDSLSRTHFFLGNIRRANKIQDIMYRLQQRRFSADSDQYIDALMRRARWYAQVGDFTEATFAFRRLERNIMKHHGRDDPRLIDPLIELAFVAPRQSTGTPGMTPEIALKEARRAMKRAVRIARVQNENDPAILPSTLVAEADFLLFATATRSARLSYEEAYALTVSNPDLADLHQELFAEPKPVVRTPIRSVYHRDYSESAMGTYPDRGFVELEFDLNVNGRPNNIRVIESFPAGLMDTDVIRRVRRFVYRPGFANGTPVSFQNVQFRHDFRYDERRLTQSEKEFIERNKQARERARAAQEAMAAPTVQPGTNQEPELTDDETATEIELAPETEPTPEAEAEQTDEAGDDTQVLETAAQDTIT